MMMSKKKQSPIAWMLFPDLKYKPLFVVH